MSNIVYRPDNLVIISATKNEGETFDLTLNGDIRLEFQNFKINSHNVININSEEESDITSIVILNNNVKFDQGDTLIVGRSISFDIYYDGEFYHITQDIKYDSIQTVATLLGQPIFHSNELSNPKIHYDMLYDKNAWNYQHITWEEVLVTSDKVPGSMPYNYNEYTTIKIGLDTMILYDGDYITYININATQSSIFRINKINNIKEVIDVPKEARWLQYDLTEPLTIFNNYLTNEFAIQNASSIAYNLNISWGTFDNLKTISYPWGEPNSLFGINEIGNSDFVSAVSNGNLIFNTTAVGAPNGVGVYVTNDGENFTRVISESVIIFNLTSNGAIYARSTNTSNKFFVSIDNGVTFTTCTAPNSITASGGWDNYLHSRFLEYINVVWILVTNNNGIYTSPDLINWIPRTSQYAGGSVLNTIITMGDIIAVGRSSAATTIQYSTDNGTTWQLSGTLPNLKWIYGTKLSDGTYILMSTTANTNGIITTTDFTNYVTPSLTSSNKRISYPMERGGLLKYGDKLYFSGYYSRNIMYNGVDTWTEDLNGSFMEGMGVILVDYTATTYNLKFRVR